MTDALVDLLVAALLLLGALFAFVAGVGLIRLPDLYTRMHAASKAGTLGSGVLLIALAVHDGTAGTASRALAGVVFFLLTAPISAHLLARAAYSVGYRMWDRSIMDEMRADPPGRDVGEDH